MSRALKHKKRRKREPKGRAVRLSNELLAFIEPKRKSLRSYDAFFRKVFGLPAWDGTEQPLLEGCLETTTGRFFLKTENWDQAEKDAYEVSITEAAKHKVLTGKPRVPNKPIRMREIG